MSVLFKSFILGLFVFLFVFAGNVVIAQETESEPEEETTSEVSVAPSKSPRGFTPKQRIQNIKEKNQEIKSNIKERQEERKEKRAEKLSDQRLKICERRSQNIGKRINNVTNRGARNHQRHDQIYVKVDKFYNDKLVPNGYTLSDYADLKALVEANKETVKTLLDSAKTTGAEFDCSSEDPKTQLTDFTSDLKELVQAEKAYRESIRNFVKAVRDLAKEAREDKLSVTPTLAEGEDE